MVNKKKSGKKNGKIRQELLWSVSISAVRAWKTLSAKSMRKQSRKILLKSWQKRFNFQGGHAIMLIVCSALLWR